MLTRPPLGLSPCWSPARTGVSSVWVQLYIRGLGGWPSRGEQSKPAREDKEAARAPWLLPSTGFLQRVSSAPTTHCLRICFLVGTSRAYQLLYLVNQLGAASSIGAPKVKLWFNKLYLQLLLWQGMTVPF